MKHRQTWEENEELRRKNDYLKARLSEEQSKTAFAEAKAQRLEEETRHLEKKRQDLETLVRNRKRQLRMLRETTTQSPPIAGRPQDKASTWIVAASIPSQPKPVMLGIDERCPSGSIWDHGSKRGRKEIAPERLNDSSKTFERTNRQIRVWLKGGGGRTKRLRRRTEKSLSPNEREGVTMYADLQPSRCSFYLFLRGR
ncbi:hypothetical protein BT69DRAFT_1288282 [Atractiella rhizophila]|nr:hypothetical protein BT69DRAFT_1288282 [Atractiella rhizophila]